MAFLVDAYNEEEVKGETRVVLKFHPKLAPIKVAILPLAVVVVAGVAGMAQDQGINVLEKPQISVRQSSFW